MAKGIVVEVTLTRDINVLIFIKLIRLPYFIKYRNISTSVGQLQNQYFFHMIFEFSVFVLFFFFGGVIVDITLYAMFRCSYIRLP